MNNDGLYICMISVHGLIRGEALELGRDADTGGQTRYVVELARALADRPEVDQVDLVARRVEDPAVSADYAAEREALSGRAAIIRVDAGPPGYHPKEQLWDYLDAMVDNVLAYLQAQPRMPDVLHSHYADAGYVGSRLAHLLGIPLIHTGHSLGRVKRKRLLAAGVSPQEIEDRFNMRRRIQAEETTLATCERVITSTQQEISEQYELYDFYCAARMEVIPPGTDLSRFHPPTGGERQGAVAQALRPFLRDPEKPMVVVLARPVPRKNLIAQIEAFGLDPRLRERANLVVVAGTREDIEALPAPGDEILAQALIAVDRHDLWGHVALPKNITSAQVPDLYRLAAALRGVHLNAALTEPFGLTLIEAAACGLPIVATADGGPRDIIGNCENGVLVDPLDPASIAAGLLDALDPARWEARSVSGLRGVEAHYSWAAHARRYVEMASGLQARTPPLPETDLALPPDVQYHDQALATDLDAALLAHPEALDALARTLRSNQGRVAFVVTTGRDLESALKALRGTELPRPDVLITDAGTRIHYHPNRVEDTAWTAHVDYQWSSRKVRRVLEDVPGLTLQPRGHQRRHKVSYFVDPTIAPPVDALNQRLYQAELSVNVVLSFGQYLDVIPIRASKGLALRHAMSRLEIPPGRVLAVGVSGAEEDMLRGNTLAVVLPSGHSDELAAVPEDRRVYRATVPGPSGVLEGAAHYGLFEEA